MKPILKATLALAALAIVLLAANLPMDNEGYEVGDTAADFNLMNVDGEYVSMADYPDANGYIVIFTCNTCPWAKLYEDRIIELNNKMEPQGWPVIAIQPNDPQVQPGDSFEAMKERAEEKGFTFPYLLDKGQKIYPLYGATRTPHVYLLDKERTVRYIGAIDDSPRDPDGVEVNYIENAVEAIKNGQDPDPDFTKAIGCTIKTKSQG